MQKPPKQVWTRPYLNLDHIFGHVYSNVVGEPLTPMRIAIFYLVRVLFETHFGDRYYRSPYQFSPEDKGKVFQVFFALYNTKTEHSYKWLKRYLLRTFGADRQICRTFFLAMEDIRLGYRDVLIALPDEFYTNRHRRRPNQPRDCPMWEIIEMTGRYDIPFCSSQSVVYGFMKRMLGEVSRVSNSELLKLTAMFRVWLDVQNEMWYLAPTGFTLDLHISTSMKTRDWCERLFKHVNKSPYASFHHAAMRECLEVTQKLYPDIAELWLHEAINFVQMKDSSRAISALKAFFDYAMFELNEDIPHCSRTYRLAVPSNTPLMYAPILQARVCRIFGDYETARSLLHESIQQAQLRSDEVCHEMANLEMHIVDIIGNSPLLEGRKIFVPNAYVESDRRVQRKALKHIDDLHGHARSGPCCQNTEDDFEIVAEMDSFGKMVMILKTIIEGRYKLNYDRIAETGLSIPLQHDYKQRGMKVMTYGHSIISSNMIRNGMYEQAGKLTRQMGVLNFRVKTPENWRLEFNAVGMANYVYSFSAAGKYKKAREVLLKMRDRFLPMFFWQANRHFVIAETVVYFEQSFLRNEYNDCNQLNSKFHKYSELEFSLRHALVLAATGRACEGAQQLKATKATDVRSQIRIHMQLATIYTASKYYEKADVELRTAMTLAGGTTFKDIQAMLQRRYATMLMCVGKYEQAVALLQKYSEPLENYTTFIEKLCYYMTVARCYRELGRDPRVWLRMCRGLLDDHQWPAMTKLIYVELALLHDPKGLMPDENRLFQVREEFGKLHKDFPGKCEFLLI